MKKILTSTVLILIGIIAAVILIMGAVVDLVTGILSMIFWSILILIGYFYVKKKVKD